MLSTSRRESGVGLVPGPDEPGHARGVADDRPAVVVELAAAQEVAGEDLLLDDDLLALLELDHVLHGDDHLVDAVLHVHGDGPAVEVGLHLVLVAGVGVHHVPPAGLVVGADDEGLFLLVVLVQLVGLVGLGALGGDTVLGHLSSGGIRLRRRLGWSG